MAFAQTMKMTGLEVGQALFHDLERQSRELAIPRLENHGHVTVEVSCLGGDSSVMLLLGKADSLGRLPLRNVQLGIGYDAGQMVVKEGFRKRYVAPSPGAGWQTLKVRMCGDGRGNVLSCNSTHTFFGEGSQSAFTGWQDVPKFEIGKVVVRGKTIGDGFVVKVQADPLPTLLLFR
jgi:hypothetical protein